MAPTTAKSLMKEFRASFRKKKDPTSKVDKAKETEEEENARLVELKESLGENLPARYKDSDLLSFIRARSLNVKEAEKLLHLDMNLRRFLQLDDFIKNHELSEINRDYSCSGLIGYDKEGCLVRIISIGYSDIKGYMNSVSTIENFKLFIWYMERDRLIQEAENKRTGRNNNQLVYIINLDQISLGKVSYKPAVDTGLLALKLLQDHFHDLPKRVFIINTPAFFTSVYKLFKPVLQESFQKKITILDSDGWKEELLNYIDKDILPAFVGGNCVDSTGNGMCTEYIRFGGTIPKSLYFNNFLPEDDPDLVRVSVPAGSSLNFRFPVPVVGSIYRWYIQARDNDIGIGVYWDVSGEEPVATKDKSKEDMSKYIQVTPIIRSQCHICPEVGKTISWLPGTLIMHLDNSYSWMQSKEISYKITIEPPAKKKDKPTTHVASKKTQQSTASKKK